MAIQRVSTFEKIIILFIIVGLIAFLWTPIRLIGSPFYRHVNIKPNPVLVGTWNGTAILNVKDSVLNNCKVEFHMSVKADGTITGTVGEGEFVSATLAQTSPFSFWLGLGTYCIWATLQTSVVNTSKMGWSADQDSMWKMTPEQMINNFKPVQRYVTKGWAACQITLWEITPGQMMCRFRTLDPVKPDKPQLKIHNFTLSKI